MKKHLLEFVRRGLVACGFGPLILVVLYGILHCHAGLEILTVRQVCVGILSLTALAFVASLRMPSSRYPMRLSVPEKLRTRSSICWVSAEGPWATTVICSSAVLSIMSL